MVRTSRITTGIEISSTAEICRGPCAKGLYESQALGTTASTNACLRGNRRVITLKAAYSLARMLERIFRLKENGSTAGREVVAGLTTFAAMAYILAVNPTILKNAGMPEAALVTATALSAAVATPLMALLTNFPLALAPGMGINAFFAFSICIGMEVPWQSALGLSSSTDVYFCFSRSLACGKRSSRPSHIR